MKNTKEPNRATLVATAAALMVRANGGALKKAQAIKIIEASGWTDAQLAEYIEQ